MLKQLSKDNVVKALQMKSSPRVKAATLLSVKKNFACETLFDGNGLTVTFPRNARLPSDVAQVVKIEFE